MKTKIRRFGVNDKMKKNLKRYYWLAATIGIFALVPAQGPGGAPLCDPPKLCIGGNSDNGKQCGPPGWVIETDESVSYPASELHCTIYNPLYLCQGDCNEKEWWHGFQHAVYCVKSGAPDERVFLYYCYYQITSKVRGGVECDHCN